MSRCRIKNPLWSQGEVLGLDATRKAKVVVKTVTIKQK